jgi:tetratricopeptide (TPR) repeat protein
MEVQDLERRVARDPEAAVALGHLARAYLSIGVAQHDSVLIDRAEAKAKSSLEIASYHNVAALEVLARVASYRHEFERSIELARQLIEIGASQGFEILIASLVAQRRLDEARGSASEFYRLQPGFSSFLQMGLTAEASGDLVTAEDNYVAALKADPQSSRTASLWSRSIVARFFLRQGRLDEASILLRKVLQFDPKYPFALGLEGELSLARGHYRVAAERFHRAFLTSRDPTYLYSAALAFRRCGDERSWRESLDAIVALYNKRGPIEATPHREVFERALQDRGN